LHTDRTACTLRTSGEVEIGIPDIKGPGGHLVVAQAGRQVEQAIADCDPSHWSDDSRISQRAGKKKSGVVRPLVFGAMAACMLLWVAFYNGYPTVFPDTGAYLYTGAFHIELPPFRAPGYSIFIELTSLGASAWFTIAIQAIVVVAVLHRTCKYLLGGESDGQSSGESGGQSGAESGAKLKFRDNCLLAIVCLLAAVTSLPWEASQLMPDVFAGVVFLSAFLLVFDDQLRLTGRVILSTILAISVSSHLSLLPIATLFAAVLALTTFANGRVRRVPPAKSTLVWLLVPIIAAGLWTATLNRRMGLGFRLSVSGNEFLLSSLFGKGLAADFLHENCPKKPFVACRYLSNLPKTPGQFLFWHPLLPAMAGHEDEMQQLVRETIVAHPVKFVMSSSEDTFRQFATFRTGDEIRETNSLTSNGVVIQQIFAGDSHAYSNDRQSHHRLNRLANFAAILDTLVFWLSAVACLVLAWTKRAERVNVFFYSAILFLVINAAICATFAGVYDRYQSRVAWLVPFCLMSYICSMVKDRNSAIS
jgi:hypothetical protein